MPPIVGEAAGAAGRGWAGLRSGLPFGYRARREKGVLILRRPDGSFVWAFPAKADPFEVEATVWEDAD